MAYDPNHDPAKAEAQPAAHGLGASLREMFDSVARGPMPDQLVALVDRLERAHEARQAEARVGERRSLAEV
jgi:hypothetical protein